MDNIERQERFKDVANAMNALRDPNKMTWKNVHDKLSYSWKKKGIQLPPTIDTVSQIIFGTCVVVYSGFVSSRMRLGYRDQLDCPNCPFYNRDLGGSCTIGDPVARIFTRYKNKINMQR